MSNKIIEIQSELKAPKTLKSKFGGYTYRSCEDILQAAKPILKKHSCFVLITDSIENFGDRYYVKSTVELHDDDGKLIASSSAYARECADRKGMDEAQITGASSSYARKYALNGLFAIDDSRNDPDSSDNLKEGDYPQTQPKVQGDLPKEKPSKKKPDPLERAKEVKSGEHVDPVDPQEGKKIRAKIDQAWKALGKTNADEAEACKFVGSKFAKIDGLSVTQLRTLLTELQRQMNARAGKTKGQIEKEKKAKQKEPNPVDEQVPMEHLNELIAKLPEGSEPRVNEYLINIRYIEQGQTIRNLKQEYVTKILSKFENFLRVSGIGKEAA